MGVRGGGGKGHENGGVKRGRTKNFLKNKEEKNANNFKRSEIR